MPEPYLFLRPLLGAAKQWAALEWCAAGTDPGEPAKRADWAACFVDSGAAPLANILPLVFQTDSGWLAQSEFLEKFTPAQAVFVLPAAVLEDAPTLERCVELRRKGRHLALKIDRAQSIERVPVTAFDHLQLDAALARYELSALDLNHIGGSGCAGIASGVSSSDLFDWVQARQFALSDSSFVTLLDPTGEREPDLSRFKVLKLLSLVIQDADTRQIEAVFREEARLAHNLLRLVNSVAVAAKTRISSFAQAIALLGRRQLQRWLQLLIYADQFARASRPSPLLQLAAARGRQLELLSAALASSSDSQELGDAAYMTGIFSLLDVLLKMPMGEILAELPLPAEIRDALLSRQGKLGVLLAAVVAGEARELEQQASELLARLGIDPASHTQAQVRAFFWASRISFDK